MEGQRGERKDALRCVDREFDSVQVCVHATKGQKTLNTNDLFFIENSQRTEYKSNQDKKGANTGRNRLDSDREGFAIAASALIGLGCR